VLHLDIFFIVVPFYVRKSDKCRVSQKCSFVLRKKMKNTCVAHARVYMYVCMSSNQIKLYFYEAEPAMYESNRFASKLEISVQSKFIRDTSFG